ncbi:MAG TPA: hypothetical protein VFB62_11075 [Polyangiaceae bacterium]|nr:hypothetical protein [Polyangiaceae bacterium]
MLEATLGRSCAVVMLALVLVLSSKAAAQNASNKAAAESLFQEGQAAMEAGKLDIACAKLAESLELERAVGTLLNLARCHELSGKRRARGRNTAKAPSSPSAKDRPIARAAPPSSPQPSSPSCRGCASKSRPPCRAWW